MDMIIHAFELGSDATDESLPAAEAAPAPAEAEIDQAA